MRGRIDLNLPRPDVAHPTASFRRYRVREATTCALFLTPALLFLAVSSFYPLLYSLYLSFHDWNMTIPFSRPYFVGADGYLRLVRDSDFHRSFLRTLDFVGSAVSIELVLGLGVAVLITSRLPIIGVARTVFLFPLMMTPVVVGVLWRQLFHSLYGVVNYVLSLVRIPSQVWLGSPTQALPATVVVEVWQQLPVVAFILGAGIQSLGTDYYEAAQIDGASAWQVFRYVTLPLLRPYILIVLLLRIVDAFRAFDVIFTLTQGGPGETTEFLSLLIYKTGLKFFDVGRAAAMSWAFLALLTLIALPLIRNVLRSGAEA